MSAGRRLTPYPADTIDAILVVRQRASEYQHNGLTAARMPSRRIASRSCVTRSTRPVGFNGQYGFYQLAGGDLRIPMLGP